MSSQQGGGQDFVITAADFNSKTGVGYLVVLVGEPNTTVPQLIDWLVRKKLIVKDGDGYTIYVPTNALAKERDGTIWIHVRDYKPLVGD